jgi:aryl-alcohol dehydrogenase-like predicted oxidoreductase
MSQVTRERSGAEPEMFPAAESASIELAGIEIPDATGPTETVFSGPVGIRDLVAPARKRVADTDLWVFPLALSVQRFGRNVDTRTAVDLLDRYREGGGNLIDTVDSVAARRTEQLIGAWLRRRACRDDMLLAATIGGGIDSLPLTPANIVASVDATLQRLGVERIELLFLREAPGIPVELEESLGAVDALIHAGKVGTIAASGFSADRLIEARVLAANGLPRFAAIQTPYNLVERGPVEGSTAVVAVAQGLAVFPTSPLAHGALATNRGGRDESGNGRISGYLNRRMTRVRTTLDRIGNDHGVPAATIAIAWLLARRGVVAPLAGVRDAGELAAVMAAPRVHLTRSDMLDIDRVTL